ncbi:MAG: hypothetical protein ISR57_01005 [Bacteroidales bacterium]|nr:hypothetical protein [Bacteroidales bacterium]
MRLPRLERWKKEAAPLLREKPDQWFKKMSYPHQDDGGFSFHATDLF